MMVACINSQLMRAFKNAHKTPNSTQLPFPLYSDRAMTNWSTVSDSTYALIAAAPQPLSPTASDFDIAGAVDAAADRNGVSDVIEHVIYTRLIGIVCLLGIIGNSLNLFVLTRKSLTYTMERMEKSAHYGLVGLAVSDMLVCIAVLPRSIYGPESFGDGQFSFRFLYMVYGEAVISSFVLSSTWLTVTMATGRYLAVCHPLHARQFIGKRFSVWSLLIVFIVCTIFNVPRYFRLEIQTLSCEVPISSPSTPEVNVESFVDFSYPFSSSSSSPVSPSSDTIALDLDLPSTFYYPIPGPLRQSAEIERAYGWTYFALGIIVPLTTLVYCNVHLSLALRRSIRMRCHELSAVTTDSMTTSAVLQAASRRREQSASRITSTLVAIIVSYVTLFVPGELVNFFASFVTDSGVHTDVFNVTVAVLNLLQTVNFAFNFVLYCIVNAHFRRTVCRLAGCRRNAALHSDRCPSFCWWCERCENFSDSPGGNFTAKSSTRYAVGEDHKLGRVEMAGGAGSTARRGNNSMMTRIDDGRGSGCSGRGGSSGGSGGSGHKRLYGSVAASNSFV